MAREKSATLFERSVRFASEPMTVSAMIVRVVNCFDNDAVIRYVVVCVTAGAENGSRKADGKLKEKLANVTLAC